jgi:hypothetical protein
MLPEADNCSATVVCLLYRKVTVQEVRFASSRSQRCPTEGPFYITLQVNRFVMPHTQVPLGSMR